MTPLDDMVDGYELTAADAALLRRALEIAPALGDIVAALAIWVWLV